MKTSTAVAALTLFSILIASACAGPGPPAGPAGLALRTKSFDLGPMTIDGLYHSMDGPWAETRFDFSDMDWIQGFRSEVLDARTGGKMPDELFCHSQLQLDNDTRLIVAAMGMPYIRFPDGFGIPFRRILAGMPETWRGAKLFGMVLNNHDAAMRRDVKVRLTLEYLSFPDGAAPPAFRKLYKQGLTMTHEHDAAQAEIAKHAHHEGAEGAGCGLVGGLPEHWYVPPGRQVTKRRFTGIVPVDARVHYAAVHLHNYGRYMRLTDLTEGKVLWQSDAVYEPGRAQITEIPVYSSVEGFPVYADHEYEIEALYDNTTSEPVDAMAMMYLFWNPPGNEDITYPGPPQDRSTGG